MRAQHPAMPVPQAARRDLRRRSGPGALLLVTGDPMAAFVDLVSQAGHAGLRLQAEHGSGDACWLSAVSSGRRGGVGGDLGRPFTSRFAGNDVTAITAHDATYLLIDRCGD